MLIQLLLTCYGLLNGAEAQIYMTVSASYIVQDEPFSINCSSDVPPLGDAVSFGKESVDILNVRYLSSIPACYGTLSSGLQPPYKCKYQCECSKDRRSYQWTFNGKDVNDVNTFHCTMLFPMSGSSTQSVFILKAIAPELDKDTNSSSVEEIRIADGQNLNITVVVIAHPGPNSVFWLFRYDNNTDPVKIPKNCTTYGQARYTCSLFVKETNRSNFGRYILHFQNEIGVPLNVQFVVKRKEMPSPPDFDAICAENKVSFHWISGFDGGDKQVFHVIALSEIQKSEKLLVSIADEGFGTHNKLSVDMEPGRYIFYIFTNNSYGGVNSSTTSCSVVAVHDVPIEEQSTCYSVVSVTLPSVLLAVFLIMYTVALVYRNQRHYNDLRNNDLRQDIDCLTRRCIQQMEREDENTDQRHYNDHRNNDLLQDTYRLTRHGIQFLERDVAVTYV